MKKVRKLIVILLSIIMVMTLSACAPSDPAPAAPDDPAPAAQDDPADPAEEPADDPAPAAPDTVLTIWTLQQHDGDVQGAQERAVEAFEVEHNVSVEVTAFPYEMLRDRLLVALAGGEGPDILMMDQIWVGQYAAAGWVIPIDDRLAASDINREDFFEGAWGAGSYLGQYYGVPFDVGVWAFLYYNRDMFREVGLDPYSPPTTWDEMLEIGEQLMGDNRYGTAIWVGTGDAVQCMTNAFIHSGGGQIVSEDNTRGLLNCEAGVAALDFWKALDEISPAGSVGRTEEDSFALFTSGLVGMFFYGEWGQETIAARAPDMDYGMALLPIPEGGQSIGTFGGFLLGINAVSEHQDLAWEFIEFVSTKENNMAMAGLTPAHREAARTFLQENRLFPDIIYEQLTTAGFRPSVPNYPELAEIQRRATEQVLLDVADSQTALDEAAAAIDELLRAR